MPLHDIIDLSWPNIKMSALNHLEYRKYGLLGFQLSQCSMS